MNASVHVMRNPVVIPTYALPPPDKNPMFLEKRVYQGSSGKVYPLPFYDRVAEEKMPRSWDAVHVENEYIRAMILPEIGGRIHVGQDKTNGYDFFYRQNVIKPALVGLAGPWISGGVEFNWPQHHRPATYMAVDVHVEEHPDGSRTVWCGDHDPMSRMKGMHGVCLHPGKAYIELKVRLHNRTALPQTFLWWANVATRVHELYQSFFPPDVCYVADHAKRAMNTYPLAEGSYYGVPYGERARHGVPREEQPRDFVPPAGRYPPNDLSWYANIPVPTSYMCMGSRKDFFGGYDHAREAGVVHIANHHISPGKKQWTWGNHEFGYAWDRNLTDEDGPYIEIMAGVYTDNQPDFSFLMPGETKTFSQYWYPIQKIGPALHANLAAAVSRRGVSVTEAFPGATVRLFRKGRTLDKDKVDLVPGSPYLREGGIPEDVGVEVTDAAGHEVIRYQPEPRRRGKVPPAATEPPDPSDIASSDELYVTGLHLDQYRHATRCPTHYWLEALRRDPLDARCNNAMGLWHLRRGEFGEAERRFRTAIERLTRRNPNPADGEPYYNVGLALRYLGRETDAYAAFYKAAWNYAWQGAAYHALAELDCRRGDWTQALDHLDRSLRVNADNLRARDLKAIVLRKLGQDSMPLLRETLALDPLDWWARYLLGEPIVCDIQTRLDLVLDCARAGLRDEALVLLDGDAGSHPLVQYYRNWLKGRPGIVRASSDYCFPSRLEEIAILEAAHPRDPKAPYYLGCLLYDKRRHEEAIRCWEKAARLDPSFSIVWRNLGIGYFNIRHQPRLARAAYDKACRANPQDARLLYERDQLWKRLGVLPAKRLAVLERHRDLVRQRDDLTVELASLYNQTGQPEKALKLLEIRQFQPWEGGEGQALGQYVRTQLALGRRVLAAGEADQARRHFESARCATPNLGEAKHLLANQSDIHYWLGVACEACGDRKAARLWWTKAAHFRGDFQAMQVRAFSELTYYSAMALKRLGRKADAGRLLRDLSVYATDLKSKAVKIDYFATSLPTMLLFDDDLKQRQDITATVLQALAHLGLGHRAVATKLIDKVLLADPAHAIACDLCRDVRGAWGQESRVTFENGNSVLNLFEISE